MYETSAHLQPPHPLEVCLLHPNSKGVFRLRVSKYQGLKLNCIPVPCRAVYFAAATYGKGDRPPWVATLVEIRGGWCPQSKRLPRCMCFSLPLPFYYYYCGRLGAAKPKKRRSGCNDFIVSKSHLMDNTQKTMRLFW